MKFGLYTDTHFGIYSDDDRFLKYQLSVIKNIHDDFEKQGISFIIIPGDIFDNRMRLNVKTLNKVKDFYSKECERFEFLMILGNHDYFNKNDNNYSSVKPIFRDLKDINILDIDVSEVDYEGFKILFCNWIFDEQHFKNELQKYKDANLVIGHFEMKDFEMVKGHLMKTGMDRKIFKNKEMVISGHYHVADKKDNIVYLGTPFQMDWNDFGQKKYYYVYDTNKRELQNYEQKDDIFTIIKLSHITKKRDNKTIEEVLKDLKASNPDYWNGKIVKFIIDMDFEGIQKIVDFIMSENSLRLQIVDSRELIKEVETEIDTNADVLTISKEYINKNVSEEINKNKLFDIFSDVYKEARVL